MTRKNDEVATIKGMAEQLMSESRPLYGSRGGAHPLVRLIDHRESYGPHVIEELIGGLRDLKIVADLGAGSGRDLAIVRRLHPDAKLFAVESSSDWARTLRSIADVVQVANIERDRLPLADGEADLILANQILEHTKEVFWIFHEVFRALRLGGHLLFGVPNVCSLHNRFLLLAGRQPTQHKLCSAHVRPFSRRDTLAFLDACIPGGYALEAFRGSQFYPFPMPFSRLLANAFPGLAFTIFFLVRKTEEYRGQFIAYPALAELETNFWLGRSTEDK